MAEAYSKKVSMIGVAHQVGAAAAIESDAFGDEQEDIIGACPLLTELAWYLLLDTLRELNNCTRSDALPEKFGKDIYTKKDFLYCLPDSFHPDADHPADGEVYGLSKMIQITRRELAEMPDDWRTIRAVIYVLRMADRIFMHGPDRIRLHGQSPFDIAAAYYRPNGQPVVKK
jgi:hypothetical protein